MFTNCIYSRIGLSPMHRLAAIVLIMLTALLIVPPAAHAAEQRKVPALLDGDFTLVPFRELSEMIGASVEWAPPHINLTRYDTHIQLTLGSNSAMITDTQGSRQATLDRLPQEIDGVIYVPLRFVSEALGIEVHFNSAKNVIELVSCSNARIPLIKKANLAIFKRLTTQVAADEVEQNRLMHEDAPMKSRKWVKEETIEYTWVNPNLSLPAGGQMAGMMSSNGFSSPNGTPLIQKRSKTIPAHFEGIPDPVAIAKLNRARNLIGYKLALDTKSLEKLNSLSIKTTPPGLGMNAGKQCVNPKDGATMVYVPAGEFLMGSTEGEGGTDEHPQHTVYLSGYWMYRTDVTVAQYRKFCAATGKQMPEEPSWIWQDEHPVVNVRWEDAKAYADWAGAALPTEAQWEKATRGTDGRIYPWGNEWDAAKCNNSVGKDGKTNKTSPVGSFSTDASPYGCLDMAGNVWQWCADWYAEDYYQHAPSGNPSGPEKGDARVLRGGSWYNGSSSFYRAAFRLYSAPTLQGGNFGFRCASRSSGP